MKIQLISLLLVPENKLKELSTFLSTNSRVRDVKRLESANDLFFTGFNLFLKSEHLTDVDGLNFQQDLKKSFSLPKVISLQLDGMV